MSEQISGTIEHIIYRSEESGYTVFSVTVEGKELTCVGFFASVNEGSLIEAEGRYTEHPSYGRQFKVEHYSFRAPETKETIEIYLGSGAFRGIGKSLAARIVKRFGDDTLRILEEEPERLAEIKGISSRMAREFGEEAARQAKQRDALLFLTGLGMTLKMSIRIIKVYADRVYEVLRTNPYRLAEDIQGIGFLTADQLAAKVGIGEDSPCRIRGGLLYVLKNAAAEGSVYLPERQLLDRAADLLGVPAEAAGECLQDLVLSHSAVRRLLDPARPESAVVYISSYYYLELNAARKLLDLSRRMGIREEESRALAAEVAEKSGVELGEEQQRALELSVMNGVMILTGGPGTGKTTTINELIRLFLRQQMSVLLAAPTGRAAKRMTETTGYEASTIHRLLEITANGDDDLERVYFQRNEENPLEADVIIIDEMSMVDLPLFHALVSAVVPGTRLILVGDVNQLPSVGPGCVLRDILKTGAFPSVTLTKIFRQAATSDIVVNAHRINNGEQIALDNKSRDFFFLKRDDPDRIISHILQLLRGNLADYVHARPDEIQILAPMRKGRLGVERLNTVMQQQLNPPARGKKEKEFGDRIFRVGDKVMQMRNNYQLSWEVRGRHGIPKAHGEGIFNGDLGTIRDLSEMGKTLEIEFDEGRVVDYPFSSLEDLELAYAATIHKSQGSEYPAVILPLLGGPRMLLTRNLLYTAVTRARSCVILIGSEDTVRDMIRNDTELDRYTSLDLRIAELLASESRGQVP